MIKIKFFGKENHLSRFRLYEMANSCGDWLLPAIQTELNEELVSPEICRIEWCLKLRLLIC